MNNLRPVDPAIQQEVYYQPARPSMTGQAAVGRVPTPPPRLNASER